MLKLKPFKGTNGIHIPLKTPAYFKLESTYIGFFSDNRAVKLFLFRDNWQTTNTDLPAALIEAANMEPCSYEEFCEAREKAVKGLFPEPEYFKLAPVPNELHFNPKVPAKMIRQSH